MPAGSDDVTLAWKGRQFAVTASEKPSKSRSRARSKSLSETPAGTPTETPAALLPDQCLGPEVTVEESLDGAGPAVRIIQGDALEVARALGAEGLAGKVDLVYVDPPYASDRSWGLEARLDGPADGRVRRHVAYDDKLDTCAYLDMLAPRLHALTDLLAPAATIWVHLDWRSAYLVRVLLDELLGRDAFLNEIVWRRAPNLGRQATSQQFGRTLDTILVYAARPRTKAGAGAVLVPPTRFEPIDAGSIRWDEEKRPFTTAPRGDYTDASIERLAAEGRIHRSPTGKVYVKYFLVKNADGAWCRERRVDALWTDVPPLRHAAVGERTGFPTQKPRALLDRIITCATKPGALVVDLFGGSGTTGESAHALGRRVILGDAGDAGIATSRARLARFGAALSIERCGVRPSAAGGGIDVDVSRAAGSGDLRVTLLAPTEPLAWAVDPAFEPGRPFHAAWHSERVPGGRAQPAAREALVSAREGATVAVRVFTDEGAVATRVLPSAAPAPAPALERELA